MVIKFLPKKKPDGAKTADFIQNLPSAGRLLQKINVPASKHQISFRAWKYEYLSDEW